MRLITGEGAGQGEPEDGWQGGPDLLDSINITITLCQFSGQRLESRGCTHRLARMHPDVDCAAVYILGSRVLDMGVRDLTALLVDPPANLRRPALWTSP